jgi:hypothetical protein
VAAFAFTAKQQEARKVLSGSATHIALEGGSRSGKTFLFVDSIIVRAMAAAGSRHAILRYRFNHLKASVIADTFPKVLGLRARDEHDRFIGGAMNKTDWYFEFKNGSQVWFGGLDDKQRTEKILGSEFATIFLNECSQIPKESRDMALTRLAQKSERVVRNERPTALPLRMYYDLNPTNQGHWAYKLFHQKIDPETKLPLSHPDDYAVFKLNPYDNAENLHAGYLDSLRGMSARFRKRFLEGEYADENPNALFSGADIDKWRVLDGAVPKFVRIVIAVDPSGAGDSNNADNDAIGICVAALGTDGNAYVLEDLTVKAGPATWGRIATSAYDRHKADVIVGEENFGGDMVRHTVQTARPRTNYKKVSASRGKVVRAEPISALYEFGKVRHVGNFPEMEDELQAFSTAGYTGPNSPNRADALIWALTELFPGLTKPEPTPEPEEEEGYAFAGENSWMSL